MPGLLCRGEWAGFKVSDVQNSRAGLKLNIEVFYRRVLHYTPSQLQYNNKSRVRSTETFQSLTTLKIQLILE